MTDIPIIFSAPMIRALLEDRKTMTRRLACRLVEKLPQREPNRWRHVDVALKGNTVARMYEVPSVWQRVQPGDRLWVRETWANSGSVRGLVHYAAQMTDPHGMRWQSPIHMFRTASRATLIVEAVRVERLQDITMLDVLAEGAPVHSWHWFQDLWIALHGQQSWLDNPEVVAILFRVVKANIDKMADTA